MLPYCSWPQHAALAGAAISGGGSSLHACLEPPGCNLKQQNPFWLNFPLQDKAGPVLSQLHSHSALPWLLSAAPQLSAPQDKCSTVSSWLYQPLLPALLSLRHTLWGWCIPPLCWHWWCRTERLPMGGKFWWRQVELCPSRRKKNKKIKKINPDICWAGWDMCRAWGKTDTRRPDVVPPT